MITSMNPSTLADRTSARERRLAANPPDPMRGLTMSEDFAPVIDRNGRLKADSYGKTVYQRLRTFSLKRNPLRVMATQIDDGPIVWESSPRSNIPSRGAR